MDIQKIVKALIADGLTQAEIAKKVDCSQPTISDIANGRVGKARPSYKVASGLKVLATEHGIADDGSIILVDPKLQESV
jgi:transcriptional regulator with XRE-family HTH domain